MLYGRPWVAVSIADQGTGIKPENRDRLFSPSFTTKEGGTGLGLKVARRITEAHGGTLTVEPGPAGGATATVRLPCVEDGPVAGANAWAGMAGDDTMCARTRSSYALSTASNEEVAVNKQKVLTMARKLGIEQPGKMETAELIRAIQTKEGNKPCFMAGVTDCREVACLWRADCQAAG